MVRRVEWEYALLAVVLVVFFLIRIELSSSVHYLSYQSYLTVRSVEHILQTGLPLTTDPLSVTGIHRIGSPLYDYLLSALVWLTPAAYKIVPNLLMTLVLIPVFLLTKRISNTGAAFAAVFLAGSGPLFFSSYLNTPVSGPLAIGLFLLILALIHEPDRWILWFIGLSLLLTFLHPLAFVLAGTLLVMNILLRLEGFGVDRRIGELFFFTLMLSLWFNVLVYKKPLFQEGVDIIRQNLPPQYLETFFGSISALSLLYGLGVVTFLFGVLGIYHALFESRSKEAYSVVSGILVVVSLLGLRLIELRIGMVLLSALVAIMAGYGLLVTHQYLLRTKWPWMRYVLAACVLLLFCFTAILPGLSNAQATLANAPTKDDVAAFQELEHRVPPNAVVLTTVKEGAAVQYFSGRRTLTEDEFILVDRPEELIQDVDGIYTSRFLQPLLDRAEKRGIDYILFSDDARELYGRDRLLVDQGLCLSSQKLTPDTLLYRVACGGSRG